MSIEDLMSKNKLKADDYILISLIVGFLLFALIFRLAALVSVIIYPLASLGIMGTIKIVNAFNKRKHDGHVNGDMIIRGIIYIIFSVIFITFILSLPNITSYIIISIITFPIFVVGCAGIIKGMLIEIYSIKYRIINILIGLTTITICFFILFSVMNVFLINIIIYSILLFMNVLSRAALYLSEYGVSLFHKTNYKLFFYIISDYFIYIEVDGNVVLRKMQID